jgi:hypothetical protein
MKAKLFLAIFLCVAFAFSLQARDLDNNGSFGISFSGIGLNGAYHFGQSEDIGTFRRDGFFSIGFNYLRPIFDNMEIKTGLEFARFNYRYNQADGGWTDANLSMITIPLTARVYFRRFFFINGGLLLDFETNSSEFLTPQSGLGLVGGAGLHYDFPFMPVGIFVNPYIRHRSLLLFSSDDNRPSTRTWNVGIRIGLVYNLRH